MGQCIYCRTSTTGSEGLAHVLPEAVVQNDLTLPRGAVCDSCNHYLGHELDSTIANYPAIAIFVQFGALPGKRGSYRELLGGIAITGRAGSKLDLEMSASERDVQVDEAGRHIVSWTVAPTAAFHMLRFRRALHHIALNEVARSVGAAYALKPKFDRIRDYVRRPRRGESWPFAERELASANVEVRWPYESDPGFVAIDIGFTAFLVGLEPDEDFSTFASTSEFRIVDRSALMPDAARITYVEEGFDAPAG